jgi:hypothetical protein
VKIFGWTKMRSEVLYLLTLRCWMRMRKWSDQNVKSWNRKQTQVYMTALLSFAKRVPQVEASWAEELDRRHRYLAKA